MILQIFKNIRLKNQDTISDVRVQQINSLLINNNLRNYAIARDTCIRRLIALG